MRNALRGLAVIAATSTLAVSAPASSQAASPGDLCYAPGGALLWQGPNLVTTTGPAWIRILDYRGPYHYLARWSGVVGQIERSVIDQSSCYQ